MENFAALVPLMVIIPFAGMLFNLFVGKYMSEKMVGFVASLAAGTAFGIALIMTIAAATHGFEASVVNAPLVTGWISIPSAGVEIPWQFRVDTLSLTMMLVVTGVGTLIHIYAIGYMHGDPLFPRFFVYLNLFLAFMLILVTGNNFLMTFVGWEGVGLCSFLLIGFWFDKKGGVGWRNSNAARKAFIVNRVGDFGFLMAIFLTFWAFGTLDYYKPGEPTKVLSEEQPAAVQSSETGQPPTDSQKSETQAEIAQKGVFGQIEDIVTTGDGNPVKDIGPYKIPFKTILTLIGLFMLLGVTGKSAQIPLFIWLPDAMAGPTPVSALIHAATMVTAGIFLVTRSNVIFHYAPLASAMVTLIGAATAIMAGFIAMGQWDIKKVLAYSTVSQLGFMVAAIGLGGYSAGMFHLVTHAFFKALLFLGSGSVIHGMEHGHHHATGHHEEAHDESHGEAHGEEAHGGHGEHHEEAVEETPFDPQDMRNMGGLAKKMPITYLTYLIGTLALSGIFPFAGFWSKDEILGKAFASGFNDGKVEGYIALGLLIVAAGFTAFYMWRQMRMVFYGTPRTPAAENASESSRLMTVPLMILAALSILGGQLNLPEAFSFVRLPIEMLGKWLEHSVTWVTTVPFNPVLAITALAIAVGAILLANQVYHEPLTKKGHDQLQARAETRQIFEWANAKLYWDEIYGRIVEQPYNRASVWLADTLDWKFWHDYVHNRLIRDGFDGLAAFLSAPVDRGAIDSGFLSIGKGISWAAGRIRRIQTGYVRTYAFVQLLGVVFILLVILYPLIRKLLGQ